MANDTKQAPKPPQTDAASEEERAKAEAEAKAKAEAEAAEKAKSAAPKPKAQGHEREALTRVKYKGKWYAPGEQVPFESAEEAEQTEKAGGVKPKAEKK